MVTFEEVRENSDDEEVSTKESLNEKNLLGNIVLKIIHGAFACKIVFSYKNH